MTGEAAPALVSVGTGVLFSGSQLGGCGERQELVVFPLQEALT